MSCLTIFISTFLFQMSTSSRHSPEDPPSLHGCLKSLPVIIPAKNSQHQQTQYRNYHKSITYRPREGGVERRPRGSSGKCCSTNLVRDLSTICQWKGENKTYIWNNGIGYFWNVHWMTNRFCFVYVHKFSCILVYILSKIECFMWSQNLVIILQNQMAS